MGSGTFTGFTTREQELWQRPGFVKVEFTARFGRFATTNYDFVQFIVSYILDMST
jgi:hypothetical protein